VSAKKSNNQSLEKEPINENEQTEIEPKTVKISKKDLVLPKGNSFLFGLVKLDYLTFEAHEYEFNNGKLVNISQVGKDTFSVLKHKLHRKIYERATDRNANGTDEQNIDPNPN
jgi:hypothetical protein